MSDFRQTIGPLYNAFNPNEPATAAYYVDCSDARGSGKMVQDCINRLRMADSCEHLLFTGHLGCGKSSELVHLEGKLDNAIPIPGEKRLFVVRMNVLEYLDEYDVAPSDMLLMIVAEFSHALKEKAAIELRDTFFQRTFHELKDFLLSDVEVESADVPLWQAKVKLKFLRSDQVNRHRVRERLRKQTTTLLTEINGLMLRARAELKSRGYDDIVLILDNLEKIRRVEGQSDVSASHRELFLENAPLLTRFEVHTIYTVPLTLARACGTELGQLYGRTPFVLPMVKLSERDSSARYEKGWRRLTEIVEKRLGGHKKDEIFQPDALDWLIRYSGGHTRQLMQFVQNALLDAVSLPIPLEAAREAIRPAIETYSANLRDIWLDKLARLYLSSDHKIDNTDPDFQEMLQQIFVMEYVNGGSSDLFSSAPPWYAPHPIVQELRPFRDAVTRLSAVSSP